MYMINIINKLVLKILVPFFKHMLLGKPANGDTFNEHEKRRNTICVGISTILTVISLISVYKLVSITTSYVKLKREYSLIAPKIKEADELKRQNEILKEIIGKSLKETHKASGNIISNSKNNCGTTSC